MRAGRGFALALVFASLFCAVPALALRHALVIGNNHGLAGEPVLRFAESDAQRIARTLVEVGSMPPEQVTTVLGGALGELKSIFREVSARLAERDELWVFVSGHADVAGVHVRGDVWGWRELRDALDGAPPRRVIAFLDACASGALLTPKGLTVEAPLEISVQSTVTGHVLFTSSGANELSYESSRLRGSPFAHFIASGLRGAADANGDGRVTVAELYGYLYGRTVAASIDAAGGPQHPQQAGNIRGAGEWVLAEPMGRRAVVRLGSATLGTCYVLDAEEIAVVAELRASDPAPIALLPGQYRVKCSSPGAARSAPLSITSGTQAIESLAFEPIPIGEALARGPRVVGVGRIQGRAGVFIDGSQTGPMGALGYVHGTDDFVFEVVIAGRSGRRVQGSLGIGATLPWWQLLETRLELGLIGGAVASFDRERRDTALVLGQFTELALPVSRDLRVLVRSEIAREIPLGSGEPRLPITVTAGFDWAVFR